MDFTHVLKLSFWKAEHFVLAGGWPASQIPEEQYGEDIFI
jgi:hypothetical protein